MATVLWRDLQTGALDRCRLETGPDGLRLSGTVLTPEHGTPLEVRYLVEAGPDGLTRRVGLELDGGATRRVLLADGAGHWRWEGGPELAEVGGSLDVDLTITPATNTLPIRRLPPRLTPPGGGLVAAGAACDTPVPRVDLDGWGDAHAMVR